MVDAQLQATETALELLAWDKARSEGRIGAAEAEQIDSMVYRGALQYQRLLGAIHGERETAPLAEGEAWLQESRRLRDGREHMTKKGFMKGARLRLTGEDIELLDRKQPERSFSGRQAGGEASAGPDIADQLERLAALHAEGALSDAEFAAAKARVTAGG